MKSKKRGIAIGLLMVTVTLFSSCGEAFNEDEVRDVKGFYDLYLEDYSMVDDGNLKLDGKYVTITGEIAKKIILNLVGSGGNKSVTALEFIDLGGNEFYPKFGLEARFNEGEDAAIKDLNGGDKVVLKGEIANYVSFDKKIELENCSVVD